MNLLSLVLEYVRETGEAFPANIWVAQNGGRILKTFASKPYFNKGLSSWMMKPSSIQKSTVIVSENYSTATDYDSKTIFIDSSLVELMNILLKDKKLKVNDGISKDRSKSYKVIRRDGESLKASDDFFAWSLSDNLNDVILYKEVNSVFDIEVENTEAFSFVYSDSSIQGEVYF